MSMPVTTTIYTNEWTRISARMRPSYYLLAITVASLLLGAASGMANQNMLIALEAFCISLVLGSALTILFWRRGTSTELNLGAQKVRSGKLYFSFADIDDLDLHEGTSNLYLLAGERKVLLPLMWLSHSEVKVIERMVRLLNNPAMPENRAIEVREYLLKLLSD